jgi:hypothetical protein
MGMMKFPPMVSMASVERGDLADRISGLISRQAIESRASANKLIVSVILKLLISKSLHQ